MRWVPHPHPPHHRARSPLCRYVGTMPISWYLHVYMCAANVVAPSTMCQVRFRYMSDPWLYQRGRFNVDSVSTARPNPSVTILGVSDCVYCVGTYLHDHVRPDCPGETVHLPCPRNIKPGLRGTRWPPVQETMAPISSQASWTHMICPG